MKVEIPPGFMRMPKDCGRGAQPVFGGVVCVDTVICNGKILMLDGRVEGEEEIIEGARRTALDLVSRRVG